VINYISIVTHVIYFYISREKMKKMKFRQLGLAALMLTLSGAAYGASIDHIQNYTPEYNANPALNGAINPGTSAYYNPAGLMQVENGRYFQVGVSGALGNQTMESGGKDYEADSLDFVPNIMFVDKNDDRAWYFTFGGLAGGAEFDYEDGVPTMDKVVGGINKISSGVLGPLGGQYALGGNEYAKGSNKYVQATLGRAWFVTEKLSVSAAGRVIYGSRELEAYLRGEKESGLIGPDEIYAGMDSERTAWGYGFSFGANYKATERLNLGARYDTKVRMNFRTDSKSSGGIDFNGDGNSDFGFEQIYGQYFNKTRRDLPAILALGAQYQITDRWIGYLSGNYYFNESADLDDEYRPEAKDHYEDGWEVSLGSEYWLKPNIAWLAGINYAKTGAGEETYHDSEYALDSIMLGTGIKYLQNPDTIWVVSVTHYIYDSETVKDETGLFDDVEYSKDYTAVGVSLTKRF